jgi:hypothetical protein
LIPTLYNSPEKGRLQSLPFFAPHQQKATQALACKGHSNFPFSNISHRDAENVFCGNFCCFLLILPQNLQAA